MSDRLPPARFAPTPLRVFVVFLAIYMVTWAGHYTSGDGAIKVQWARTLLAGGSSDLDPGPAVEYSRYGIGHTLLAMPVLAASAVVTRMTGVHTEAALYTFLFLVNGAAFLALVARYLRPNYPDRAVWTTVLLMGLATTWWPYTKLDYSEPLVATCLLWAWLEMRADRLVAGAAIAAFAMLIRTDAAVLAGWLWAVEGWRRRDAWRRMMLAGAAGVAPMAALMLAGNWLRYGALVDHGYAGWSWITPIPVGLYGILLSPGKSVFLFSPPLVLGLLAWRRFRATPHGRADAWCFLGVFAIQVLFYAGWWDWSGDDDWGVRFVIPGVMLMTIPAVELASRRALVWTAGTAGVAVQVLAVVISGLSYVLLVRAEPATRTSLYVPGTSRVDFDDIRFNPRYGQIPGHLMIIRAKLGLAPGRATPEAVERSGTPLYDTLPPDAWTRPAWDFVWMRR